MSRADGTETGTATKRAPSELRRSIERLSQPALVRLTALPKPVIPIATILLLCIGVLAPVAVGVIALAITMLWMTWLAYLSWPAVAGLAKVMRLATVGLLAVAIIVRVTASV